ncbi:MAG: hypothetical protein A2798_00335 [Candidatus Levybacteria bacterium RIFCSPHIGHO2_01_FULL_37_17]|nr:MAG: hypothetical protein A2798_00335 [Candidatus Levybacteria bacterium RIFCSPHIGHO2_01_FULL_37_17]OGH36460.1 MAG: hypothetical protein A2959_03030 [Candidatus Levybacteria bacterium RIFCSPLOWO2_01_FULL_38_23]
MTTSNLSFAKIVANPSALGWSQVYSAGKLFAAISLEKSEEGQEKDYLNVLGKEILSTLEQEFFTLETKDQESIRTAVMSTAQKIPAGIKVSFISGAVVGNVLYLYILGSGKVEIKRGQTLGTLLEAKEDEGKELKEASGFLQDKDIVILETKAFADEINESTLLEFLEKPSIEEASENLAPLIHEKENPLVSSILVLYKEGEENKEEEAIVAPLEEQKKAEEQKEEEKQPDEAEARSQTSSSVFPNLRRPTFNRSFRIKGTRNLVILLIIVVLIIFAASVLFAVKKQENDKLIAAFNSVYPAAEKKYNEGESLVDLNSSLARDSFLEAKKILDDGKSTFPSGSSQLKQIEALLSKVNSAIEDSAKANMKEATEVAESESFYLATVKGTKALAFAKDDKNVYYITSTGIFSLPNGSSTEKELVKNDSDWSSVGGLSIYNTSPYVVDKSNDQILKFLNTGSAYQKSEYLKAEVDFAKAAAITIDNNIYVLHSDGTVSKYFKGEKVDFSLKGLDKPLKGATRIYSSPDFDNIYILDKGNGRIVVVDKTGSFTAQYLSSVLANAVDFEVLEADKKVYILSGEKIYKIDL